MPEQPEDTLTRLREAHQCDSRGSRCLADGQRWPCDASLLLDIAEAAWDLSFAPGVAALTRLDATLAALNRTEEK